MSECMRIVVCIKPVKFQLLYPNEKDEGSVLMNPFDLYALEECLHMKPRNNCYIICLCMGALGAKTMLTRALAMGADEAVLLKDEAFGGSDTVATTYVLAKALKKLKNVDFIVCGDKTIDGETGQVPIGIAERLHCTYISCGEKLMNWDKHAVALTTQEYSQRKKILIEAPAVVSFHDLKLTQPTVSLLALKKAKKKKITIWGAADIEADTKKCGITGSKTKVLDIEGNLTKRNKQLITGTGEEKVQVLWELIRKNGERYEQRF